MIPACGHPSRVDPRKISNIEGVQCSALRCGKTEMFLVRPADHLHVRRGHYVNAMRAKAKHNARVHGVFVDIQPYSVHAGLTAAGKNSSTAASSSAISALISSRLAW